MGALLTAGVAAVGAPAAYAALLAGLRANQDRLLLHPGRKSPDMGPALPCKVTDWKEYGGHYRGLIVESADGAPPTRGTALIFHGNAGDAEGRVPLAAKLVQLGYRAAISEYPGFGRRSGRATLNTLIAASSDAFSCAQNRWKEPVTIWGESLGAGMAGSVATLRGGQIEALVLATPWDSLTAVVRAKMPFIPVERLLRFKLDTVEALEGYGRPVVVIASEHDRLIPIQHARRLAGSLSHSVYVPVHAGHNDWFRRMSSLNWRVVDNALAADR